MAKLKMIQVEAKTHTQAKKQADKKDMSLKEYVQYLLDSDDATNVEKYECNKFDLKMEDDKVKKNIKQDENGKTFEIIVKDK